MTRRVFGRIDDREIFLFTLRNSVGLEATITNYGARLVSLVVPDRDGQSADVVLGYDTLEDYRSDPYYMGATVGRSANRIGGASFTLAGVEYRLGANVGADHLHGGLRGFDAVTWDVQLEEGESGERLALDYESPDGEEGYPGHCSVRVVYALTDENDLSIEYRAASSKSTPINLTHHSYFNLAGEGGGSILDHELIISADAYTPMTERLIPTGEIRTVGGSPMDFRIPNRIGERIDADDEQLARAGGYDFNWVLNGPSRQMRLAAVAHEPFSGRVMGVFTTEPGMQFYTGNFLDGSRAGKGGRPIPRRSGFCLETQHFPDAPNHPNFPSTILHPGDIFSSSTIYRFGTR
jgi:aldose 1-epimerase